MRRLSKPRTRMMPLALLASLGLLGAACGLAGGTKRQGNGTAGKAHPANVTVTWQINAVSPQSPTMQPLITLIKRYEASHPWVHVQWVQTNNGGNSQQAYVVTQAAGGTVPDITFQNWATVLAGEIPKGILTNLMPYLQHPNPYVRGNKHWLDLWPKSMLPYMEINPRRIELLVGSNIETGIFYNRSEFKKAGIRSAPDTWSAFVNDLKLLKVRGITPLLFTLGNGQCNPSWYERNFETQLLHKQLSKFMVKKGLETTGLDNAVGVERGIVSMRNPAYAEGWKLLGSLRPYLAPGASSYDACAAVTANTPPLSPITPFVSGKVAMVYETTSFIPQLNAAGFKGKYGLFAFPKITPATTPYSANIEQRAAVGGPNGPGLLAIPTQRADHSMTPQKLKWVINLVQYLYSPQNEGTWINGLGEGANPPIIKGAKGANVPGLNLLLPRPGPEPTVIQGVLNGTLSVASADSGLRLLQSYMTGSMSWSLFTHKWDGMLRQGALQYATAHHINLSEYKTA